MEQNSTLVDKYIYDILCIDRAVIIVLHKEWNILPYSTPSIQPYELRMRSSGRLDTCIETARNEPVCLAMAVGELVLHAVSL